VGVGLAVGAGVAVGNRVTMAVGVAVGRAVAVDVAELKAVTVNVTVGSTVSGPRAGASTLVPTRAGEIVDWRGPAHPLARAATSSQPKSLRILIDPVAPRVTITLT